MNIFFKTIVSAFRLLFRLNNKTFKGDSKAVQPFYGLHATLTNGEEFNFEKLKNKKVLIVNTASSCGYTSQYEELEKLYNLKKNDVEILAFPANDFLNQESKEDSEIDSFCKKNYGITFPLMRKSKVVVHSTQNPVYEWLTDKDKNGWNTHEPTWNFCKYLIDEKGNLTHFFESAESPMGSNILAAIEQKN